MSGCLSVLTSVNAAAAGGAVTWLTTVSGSITLSGGNLTATNNNGSLSEIEASTSHTAGQYYFEVTIGASGVGSGIYPGIATSNVALSVVSDATGGGFVSGVSDGGVGPTYTANDVVEYAFDLTAQLWWHRVNGGAWNTGGGADPATATGGKSFSANTAGVAYFIYAGFLSANSATLNVGATAYAHTAPSGFGNW